MRFFDRAGKVALGTRVRFLGEKIGEDGVEIYKAYGVGLQPKWFPVFFVLIRDSARTITSIAEEIGHSHVSVSKIAAELIRAGLASEKGDPADGRRTLLSLSAKGRSVARRLDHQCTDVEAAVEELLTEARYDLWSALGEWEDLLERRSLLDRVMAQKKAREAGGVRIEDYRPKHQEAFRKLNEDWIRTYFKLEKPDRDALSRPKEYILDRGGSIVVATLEGKVVGVCALIKRDDQRYPYELAKMAVAPAARGRDIGWLLGKAIVEQARARGAKRLYLESNTQLKPAIGLYRKLGFREVTGPPTPYERANIQMELEL
jgi:GNAT superfamily N-acetyltransferase